MLCVLSVKCVMFTVVLMVLKAHQIQPDEQAKYEKQISAEVDDINRRLLDLEVCLTGL